MFTTIALLVFITNVFLLWTMVVSFNEQEKRAGFIFGGLFAGNTLTFLTLLLLAPVLLTFLLYLYILLISLLIILLLPIDFKRKPSVSSAAVAVDERDIMFSRNELKPGSQQFDDYYSLHPQHKLKDDKFRAKPGLLAQDASRYNQLGFAAASASFGTVDLLKNAVHEPVIIEKSMVDPAVLTKFLLNWIKKLGALDVGICLMKDEHWYSHKGRGEEYGNKIIPEHKYGIAFTVEMNQEMVNAAPSASIVMESSQQYLESGKIAIQVAKFIRNLGWEARAHIDGNYRVICPLVAHDAGLGEIGRMGLLMTPKQGPRVRIAIVTSNIPLVDSSYKSNDSVIHFCEICKKCADVCPSSSISFNDREIINGSLRWQINSESCFTYWCTTGTDCGRCMRSCPFAHPDNFLHHVVRWGVRHSWLFRHLALKMDDLFYGRKPIEKTLPEWLNDEKSSTVRKSK